MQLILLAAQGARGCAGVSLLDESKIQRHVEGAVCALHGLAYSCDRLSLFLLSRSLSPPSLSFKAFEAFDGSDGNGLLGLREFEERCALVPYPLMFDLGACRRG